MPQPPGIFAAASDKLWHALAYLVLYLSCSIAYRQRSTMPLRLSLLFGYSLAIEAIQHLVPNRYFSLLDLVANAAGLLLGVVGWMLLEQFRNKKSPAARGYRG